MERASLVAQMIQNLPAMWETQVQSLGREYPLEKEMATHSSILAWEIPGQRSLADYSPRGHKESDTTEWLTYNGMLHSNEKERTLATVHSISESLKHNLKQKKPHKSIYLLFHLYKVQRHVKLTNGVIIWILLWGQWSGGGSRQKLLG